MSRFLEALHSGRVLLMDGAMGTELIRAGLDLEKECTELWNLTHPECVRAVHQGYVDAGAEVLLTNTFQANPVALEQRGKAPALQSILQTGVALARSVAGLSRFVIADSGPVITTQQRCRLEFADLGHLDPLIAASTDADAVLLETCDSARALKAAEYCQAALKGIPILLSLACRGGKMFSRPGTVFNGHPPERFAEQARHYGVSALGVNCGQNIGIDEVLEILRRYRRVTDLPLFARPNAGTPTRTADGWTYPLTPEKLAARLPELLAAGITMFGGCCGTTPDHIAACRSVIDDWNRHHAGDAQP